MDRRISKINYQDLERFLKLIRLEYRRYVENKMLPDTDFKFSAEIQLPSGTTFSVGDIITIDPDKKYVLAKNDVVTETSPLMVVTEILDDDKISVVSDGISKFTSLPGIPDNSIVYLSDDGKLTTTYPTSDLKYVMGQYVNGNLIISPRRIDIKSTSGGAVPTKLSQLDNDKNFITLADVPSISKSDIGLDKVDNTPDLEKPVSDPTKAYINNIQTTINGALSNIRNDLNSHINDTSVHITDSERTKWNSMDQGFKDHIDNEEIHITNVERAAWNGMTPSTTFMNHAKNTDIHVTKEDKERWDTITALSGNVPTKTSQLTNDSNFVKENELGDKIGISNYYTKTQVDQKLDGYYTKTQSDDRYLKKNELDSTVASINSRLNTLSSALTYKGSVNILNDLPTTNQKIGDVWNVKTSSRIGDTIVNAGDNVVWDGDSWDVLAGIVDLSSYYTKDEVNNKIDNIDLSRYSTKDDVDNKINSTINNYYKKNEIDNTLTDYTKKEDVEFYKIYDRFIDIDPSDLPENAIVKTRGFHNIDDDGAAVYRIVKEYEDIPDYAVLIPTTASGEKYYGIILERDVITYTMFGAKLDGITDDGDAMVKAHTYQSSVYHYETQTNRKCYTVRLENHRGIIRKDNNIPIRCHGNIDLSGSQLLIQDINSTWHGFYIWGDNNSEQLIYEFTKDQYEEFIRDTFRISPKNNKGTVPPNSLIHLKQDTYAVREDATLYKEPRYETLVYTDEGMLTTPFTYEWDTCQHDSLMAGISGASGTENVLINPYTEVGIERIPSTHYYFIGCSVKLETSANNNSTFLWCYTNNAHISGFNIEINSNELHNTRFKNTMIYIFGCHNVEISDIHAFNNAGKRNSDNTVRGTSGYVIRVTDCTDVDIHDIHAQGYWGATAMNSVKNVYFARANINRIDIHNYFYNLYVDQCNLFNHSIQIGEGRGICQITNTNFYNNGIPEDSYNSAQMLSLNTSYGRIFEGRIFIDNCNVYIRNKETNQFNICNVSFAENAKSILQSYKFPEITITNCNLHSYYVNTYLVYVMVAGKRNAKTGLVGPTFIDNQYKDAGNDGNGTLVFEFIGRSIDWVDTGVYDTITVVPGQVIRTYDTVKNNNNKIVFYNHRYFLVTSAGTLPVKDDTSKPTDYTGAQFTFGTATIKHIEYDDILWTSNKSYNIGDYVVVSRSNWLDLECYRCITPGISNGYRPTHISGTVIDGINKYPEELDSVWWKYISKAEDFITHKYSPGLYININDIIQIEDTLYKVLRSGNLGANTYIMDEVGDTIKHGTSILQYIGKKWKEQTWFDKGQYCISTSSDGNQSIYMVERHSGITSGNPPIPGIKTYLDGDVIWKHYNGTDPASTSWSPNTYYKVGTIVSNGTEKYECIFDGALELPSQITIENIKSNMRAGGDVMTFYNPGTGTSIKTKYGGSRKFHISINNVEWYRFRKFPNYFGVSGNPQPTISVYDGISNNTVSGIIYRGDGIYYYDQDLNVKEAVTVNKNSSTGEVFILSNLPDAHEYFSKQDIIDIYNELKANNGL